MERQGVVDLVRSMSIGKRMREGLGREGMKGYQLDFYVFVTNSAALWYKMIKLIGSRELI